jgi:hypothetical protein
MNVHRMAALVLAVAGCSAVASRPASAQCCLSGLFSGCQSCFRQAPVYAVAPVAPVAAPMMAPVAAPPPPVMVPVQQTSYVPETTYRTEYKCVPVTSYKPSCEIDPCTGCTVECMQPVTQYVQQAVNVPVTQYRAVTTTKYVQMQPGYAAPPAAGMPAGMPAAPPAGMPAGPPAASPFSAVQTTPQAWVGAGSDISRQPVPGVAPPALPPGSITPAPTYQYQPVAPPAYPQVPTIQGSAAQTITPQAGTYAPSPTLQPVQPQPTQPPALSPAPSLRPIPELPRTGTGQAGAATGAGANDPATNGAGTYGRPTAEPPRGNAEPAAGGTGGNPAGMPVLPGAGPGAASGAFPRLLEPTSHTTSWGPSDGGGAHVQYPTAALPAWRQASR